MRAPWLGSSFASRALLGAVAAIATAACARAVLPPPARPVERGAPRASPLSPSSPLVALAAVDLPTPPLAPLIARLAPAVVAVRAIHLAHQPSPLAELLRRVGAPEIVLALGDSLPPQPPALGTENGSGVVLTPDGYVATAAHVVRGAVAIAVRTQDGRLYPAVVAGVDPVSDLALLRLGGAVHLVAAPLAPPGAYHVGDLVLYAGAPFGLDESFGLAMISATGRALGPDNLGDFLQIDARLSAGSAGGPVFDLEGRVVGLTVAQMGHAVGIGFAVPCDDLLAVLPQLAHRGRVTRGDIGVTTQPLTPLLARALGVPDASGALVDEVAAHGPAARAGARPGDVIVAVDGEPVDDPPALLRLVWRRAPGSTATLEVERGRERLSLPVLVGAWPQPAPP